MGKERALDRLNFAATKTGSYGLLREEGASAHQLPGGGYLFVAVVDYVGLEGRRLEGVGVTPDVPVPLTVADVRAGRDPGLEAALAWMSEDSASKN